MAALLLAGGAAHLGVRLLAVESGSMAPAMPEGALLLERQLPLADLAPGMVITFHAPRRTRS